LITFLCRRPGSSDDGCLSTVCYALACAGKLDGTMVVMVGGACRRPRHWGSSTASRTVTRRCWGGCWAHRLCWGSRGERQRAFDRSALRIGCDVGTLMPTLAVAGHGGVFRPAVRLGGV